MALDLLSFSQNQTITDMVAYEIQPRITRVRHLSEDHLAKISDSQKRDRYHRAIQEIQEALITDNF